MARGEPTYSLDGLKHGIERCRVNISVLKTAIKAERATIEEYEKHIRDIADARAKHAEALANIHLEVDAE